MNVTFRTKSDAVDAELIKQAKTWNCQHKGTSCDWRNESRFI